MLALPSWIVEILLEQMAALEAEDMERLVVASSAPFMEADARRRLMWRLDSLARPGPARPPVRVIEHDPAKAADFFRSIGADVVD